MGDLEKATRKAQEFRQREQEILDAALILFLEQGEDRVTVENIADRVGIGKGTIYKHFETKNQIYLLLMLRFRKALARLRPAVYLGYTAKPNIFGSLAANSLGIPVVNNITGLGAGFISQGLVTRIMKRLYRVALARSGMVFFQNPDDAALFRDEGIIRHERTGLLPGSGVDIARFAQAPMPARQGRRFRFLLIARMLRDKGVVEFVDAARALLAERDDVEFHLLGSVAVDNPAAIPARTLAAWLD